MNTIKKDIAGKIKAKARDGNEYLLNPNIIRREVKEYKNTSTEFKQHRFKLVTVRRLTSISLEEARIALEREQERLANAAAASGQPSPYPARIPLTEDDLQQVYGVYVDEDLNGRNAPIYTFSSASSNIKAFITANGAGKDEYSVHIGHLVDKIANGDGTFKVTWRLITIDNDLNGRPYSTHILESQSPDLHESFQYNFNIDALNYIGGGGWTAMSVDPLDRIPIKAVVGGDTDRYIPVGRSWKAFGSTRTVCIVAYSLTPSYTFTWCRGKLTTERRVRESSHTTDFEFLKKNGVIEVIKKSSYSLNITQRPDLRDFNINPISIPEFSESEATYIANTNAPGQQGLYQSPDFGTDSQRLSLKSYTQKTNIIRPESIEYAVNLLQNRIVNQFHCFNPVLCSSNDMSIYIRLNIGEAKGSIDHKYELKTENGRRGFQYGESYKLWWCYGRILAFYPTNDGMIFRRVKTLANLGLPSLFPTGETLLDRGELKLSEDYPNATETTWESLPNPQTGFFGILSGDLEWRMEYNNPPIFGHDAVYYYHINPPEAGIDDTLSKLDDGFQDRLNARNTLSNIFSQMQGGLGGDTTNQLDLGRVRRNLSESRTLIVLDPSPSQEGALLDTPELFPAGYWETLLYDDSYDNDNKGSMITYDREGNILNTLPHD